MKEVKVKGKKGTKGVSAQRYGDDLTKKTPRQTTPAIPETEVAQQMANEINPEVAGPRYTVTPYPADEGVASIRHQTSTSNGPVTSAEPYSYISKFEPSKEVYEPPFYSLAQTDVNGPGHFSVAGRQQIRPTNSNYGELGYIINEPEWNPQWPINAYKKTDNFKFTPMYNPHYPKERLYYKPDAPNVFTEAPDVNMGTGYGIHSLVNAKVGAGALTGLGLAAYPFLAEKGEDENINEIPVFAEAPQTQTEPTLEQQYASQSIPETDSGIWGEKINKLTHPTLKDFLPNSSIVPLSPLNREAFHQPLAVSSNFNGLVRNRYKRASDAPSELPANTSRDTFIAPRELPAKGQTLADYNKSNSPQDVTSGPRVLNAPVEKKAVTTKPVQPENRLTEANLASAMAREAASPQVLQYGSPAYLQKNKPVDMRQWVRQKYGMSMSPAEMVQRGIMPYEYLQYW